MLRIIKWTATVNIEGPGNVTLHRELDFNKESEIDAFIASSMDPYEKIPVWGEIADFGEADDDEIPYMPAEYN